MLRPSNATKLAAPSRKFHNVVQRFDTRSPNRISRHVGYPKIKSVHNSSEFIRRNMAFWAYQRNLTLDFSGPGKPTDSAHIEAIFGRFHAECLNAHWFMEPEDTAEKLEAWCRAYNEK